MPKIVSYDDVTGKLKWTVYGKQNSLLSRQNKTFGLC